MPTPTDNHDYDVYEVGEAAPWTHGPTIEQLDTDVEIRDTDANKGNYTAKQDALYLATDTGRRYVGDGSTWTELSYPVAGDGSLTTPDSVINVPSDEPTVDAALSRVDDEYYPAGHGVDINIETNHDIQTRIARTKADYRHVTITSDAAEVGVADGFGSGNIFQFQDNCACPAIDILINGQHDGAKHPSRAFQIWEGSTVFFTPGSGARNCDIGLSAMFSSLAVCPTSNNVGATFSDHTRRGASISNGSTAFLQDADLTNNDNGGGDGYGVRAGGSARVQCHFADMSDNKHGIHANQQSAIGANGVVANNCQNAVYVTYSSEVNARNLTADNCTGNVIQCHGSTVNLHTASSDGSPTFIRAVEGSVISAHNITVSNTTGDAVSIIDGSQASITGSITNSGGAGVSIDNGTNAFIGGTVSGSSNNDIVIDEGSIASLDNGLMTTNSTAEPHTSDLSHAPNQVHGAGIIFAMNPE